jgi:hypothetical protein
VREKISQSQRKFSTLMFEHLYEIIKAFLSTCKSKLYSTLLTFFKYLPIFFLDFYVVYRAYEDNVAKRTQNTVLTKVYHQTMINIQTNSF